MSCKRTNHDPEHRFLLGRHDHRRGGGRPVLLMPKLDDLLQELADILSGKLPPPDADRTRSLLTHRNPAVVSRAAQCAARFALPGFERSLCSVFASFQDNPKADPGCVAKKGLIRALEEMKFDEAEWFMAAARIVQHEPAMGGKRDSAVEVRCTAVRALCRFEWFKVCHALAERLGDAEGKVRMEAVCAVSAFGGREAELMLLTKLHCGDLLPEVLGECFRALNHMEIPDRLEIFASFLGRSDASVALEAAFAAGESRLEGAFALLRREWEANLDVEKRKGLLLAVSTIRTDEARAFLDELKKDPRPERSSAPGRARLHRASVTRCR